MKKQLILTSLIIFCLSIATNSAIAGFYSEDVEKVENFVVKDNPVLSLQSYVILSQKPVKKVYSENSNIANAYVMATIDNTRDTVIIESLSVGSTKVKAIVDNQEIEILVNVNKNGTKVTTKSDLFEVLQLDVPQETQGVNG